MGKEAIGLAIQGVSALAGSYVQYQAGQAQAKVAEQNAAVTTNEAINTLNEYSFEASTKRKEAAKAVSALRAKEGSSGFAQTGTAAWLQETTLSEYEKDAQAILAQGISKSSSLMSRAGIYTQQAKSAITGGQLSSAATLLSGVSNAIRIS